MKRPGFRHEALIYRSSEDFLAATAPFLREAFEAGERALVAVSRANTALLNVAFAPPPAWSLLCPYDGRAFDDEVLEKVAHSHSAVERDGDSQRGGEYVGRDCFAGELSERPGRAEVFEFDRGTLAEPTQEGGRGLWLVNQLCDLVQIRSRPGRTTVRLRASRH